MKRFLLAVLLMFTAATAFADIDTADLSEFNKLTEVQKAEIVMQVAKSAEGNSTLANLPTVKVAQVDQWVDLGEKVGRMLGGTAKELGIAANEFAVSPLGMVTMGLIIWNYAGNDLYGFILGIIWLGFMVPIWMYLFFKIAYPVTEYVDMKRKARFSNDIRTVSKPVRKFTRSAIDNYAYAPIAFMITGVLILFVGIVFLA